MATEVELKLYCSPEAIARIEAHPLVSVGIPQGEPKRLDNTYFDTPDLALHRERIALRIRRTPQEQLQTVKCAAKSSAGLSSRPEWETPYGGAFDFSAVSSRKVSSFLAEKRDALVPVFTTNFERKTWRVDVSKKITLLIMIDQGQVSSGDQVMPISEVELELVQGKAEDLLDFAIALATHLPLVPSDVSKAERGYQLFLNRKSGPQRAGASPLGVKKTADEAFHLLANQGLAVWQANQLGALNSPDPEFIHQFRVSLRRLNTLFKVFNPVLPDRFQKQWSKRVKALSQITGDVRDLDVMRATIVQPVAQSADPQVRSTISAAILALEGEQQAAVANLEQLRYGAPLLLFARDLQELSTEDFPKNLPRFAEKRLAGLHRTAVKRLMRTLKSPTPECAHRFRIALKHLRYGCEFFAPLFDQEEMLRYAKTIANLQDAFGFINDFHVALSRLPKLIAQKTAAAELRAALVDWHAAQAQAVLTDALHLAESVMSDCQPWCTECERRGLSSIRRRLQQDVVLQVD